MGTLPTAGAKHLVLLGAGPAHVHLLARLARHPLTGTQVSLVSAKSHLFDVALVPRFVAGLGTLESCTVAMEPLVLQAQVRWVRRNALDLDPQAQALLMDDGSELRFDWLSVDHEPVLPRDRIQLTLPGARENAMFVRPMEAFCSLWPRVTGMDQGGAIRLTVMCDGAEASQDFGMELAMAMRHRLPNAAVTLVTGDTPLAANQPTAVQACWTEALRARRITVLTDHATGVARGEVLLGCGARLACDVPVIAFSGQLTAWLGRCGLALDEQGAIAVDACQRSISHPKVFAAGAGHAAAVRLAASLAATVAGLEPKPHRTGAPQLKMLCCGDGKAIAAWGPHAAQGRLLGWLKYSIDRARISKYRTGLIPNQQATAHAPGDPHEPRYPSPP